MKQLIDFTIDFDLQSSSGSTSKHERILNYKTSNILANIPKIYFI